jgi:glutathione synthase
MLRYLYATTSYYDVYPDMKPDDFPSNNTTAGLVEGLAAAHAAYNVKE